MKTTQALVLLSIVLVAGCSQKEVHSTQYKAPYNEWYFTFTTPKALPAQVTWLKMLDVEGYAYNFNTLDQPQGSSIAQWGRKKGRSTPAFNKAKNPPQFIQFCWDSIIDKKTYETTIFFADDTLKKMITPEPYWNNPKETYYHKYMIIGLAPEGKVRVWLENNGDSDILQTTPKIKTVSGNALDMCKGITNFPNGYNYTERTNDFIKDKTYPYGNW